MRFECPLPADMLALLDILEREDPVHTPCTASVSLAGPGCGHRTRALRGAATAGRPMPVLTLAPMSVTIAPRSLNRGLLAGLLPPQTALSSGCRRCTAPMVEAAGGGDCPSADASWSRSPAAPTPCWRGLPAGVFLLPGRGGRRRPRGWRGLLAGVLERTVEAMAVEPAAVTGLRSAIGPLAFEVLPRFFLTFFDGAPSAAGGNPGVLCPEQTRTGHYYADLYALARLRLAALGVSPCMAQMPAPFPARNSSFSYRRDGLTRRMASLILINPG